MLLRWLTRLIENRADKGQLIEQARYGAKPVNGVYDQQKAVQGFKRSQQQTARGRKWPKVTRTTQPKEPARLRAVK